MEIATIAKDLFNKLSINMMAVAKNPVLPILEDFLFEINGSTLTITSTNLEITVSTQLEITNSGKKDGTIAVPSKIIFDTLKNIGEIPITIGVDKNNTIKIISLTGNYKVPGDSPEDFPKSPDVEPDISFTIKSKQLYSGISKTMVATSTDELRLALCGVLFHVKSDQLILAATDAHRLIEYITAFDFNKEADEKVILPKKGAQLLKNILHGTDTDVNIFIDKSSISFTIDGTILTCNLIDSKFPEYKTIIRVSSPIISRVDKQDLYNSLKRVAIYSDKSTRMVSLGMSDDNMVISGHDFDHSNEAIEQMNCHTTGLDVSEMMISVNNSYLRDALDVLEDEEVNIGIIDSVNSFIIVEENPQERTTVLLMPIRS